MSGALSCDVRIEFGFGSPPGAASPTWTDVSAYVALDVAPIRIEPGQSGERTSLSPRRLSFVLDNDPKSPGLTSGRFDPRNASGPYYGSLVPRVPVRVRADIPSGGVSYGSGTYGSGTYGTITSYTLFRGFVDGGWPQDWSSDFTRYVPIEAIDGVGYASQTPVPASAFEATLDDYFAANSITPDAWFRASEEGHIDRLSGKTAGSSCLLVSTDSLIIGDESTFGAVEREGFSLTQDSTLYPVQTATSSGTDLLWSAFFRADLPEGDPLTATWLACVPTSTVNPTYSFYVIADSGSITVAVGNQYGEATTSATTIDGFDIAPLDGAVHHIAVWSSLPTSGGGGAAASIRVWMDGQELATGGTSSNLDSRPGVRYGIGGHPFDSEVSASRYAGVLDHVIQWWNIGSWSVTVDEVVATVYDARLSRSGDTMDERFSWLLSICGWDHVGTVDASGIITLKRHDGRGQLSDALAIVEATEQGRIWIDNEGRFRFSNRSWAWNDTASTSVQYTFSDDPTDLAGSALPYLANRTVIVDDDRRLVNVAKVTREDGREQVVEDSASIATYGRRNPVDINNLLFPTDSQARSVAEWVIYSRSDTQPRVEELSFSVEQSPTAMLAAAVDIEPGHLIRTTRNGVDIDAHVSAVGHEISFDHWYVDLVLDGTRAGYTWFRWGTSNWGGSDGWAF